MYYGFALTATEISYRSVEVGGNVLMNCLRCLSQCRCQVRVVRFHLNMRENEVAVF